MQLGEFYPEFYKEFEPKFQKAFSDLPSQTKSIDESVNASFFEPLTDFARGGKRVRPYLIAVGADSLDEKVIAAGVAFEMLHNFILIHDDIMDGATKRRDVDTVHVAFGKYTAHGQWGAMLLGDYLSTYANEYMMRNVPELQDIFFEMQKFLYVGQYFEMLHWGKPGDPVTSEKIEYFKSAQYTFEYPLHMGLMLAGKPINILDGYSRAAGLAFQMRDDWLDISDIESGKDKGLDAENGVPNTVQLLLEDNGGDVKNTEQEVRKILGEYVREASAQLENADISVRQKDALAKILSFCVTI